MKGLGSKMYDAKLVVIKLYDTTFVLVHYLSFLDPAVILVSKTGEKHNG